MEECWVCLADLSEGSDRVNQSKCFFFFFFFGWCWIKGDDLYKRYENWSEVLLDTL